MNIDTRSSRSSTTEPMGCICEGLVFVKALTHLVFQIKHNFVCWQV